MKSRSLATIAGIGVLGFVCSAGWAATFTSTYLFNTPTDTPTLPNASFSPFTRVNLTEASQGGAFASGGWSEAATRDASQYVQFTLTPSSGYSLTLSSLSFDVWNKNSAVGPKNGFAEILLGSDSKGTASFNISSTPTGQSILFSPFSGGDGEAVTVRFYAWGSINKNQGELDFDNVTIGGSLTPVPEPVNMALAAFGLCFAGAVAYRKLRTLPKLQE